MFSLFARVPHYRTLQWLNVTGLPNYMIPFVANIKFQLDIYGNYINCKPTIYKGSPED